MFLVCFKMFLVRIPDWENSPTLPNKSLPFCWVVGNYLRQRLEGDPHTQANGVFEWWNMCPGWQSKVWGRWVSKCRAPYLNPYSNSPSNAQGAALDIPDAAAHTALGISHRPGLRGTRWVQPHRALCSKGLCLVQYYAVTAWKFLIILLWNPSFLMRSNGTRLSNGLRSNGSNVSKEGMGSVQAPVPCCLGHT